MEGQVIDTRLPSAHLIADREIAVIGEQTAHPVDSEPKEPHV